MAQLGRLVFEFFDRLVELLDANTVRFLEAIPVLDLFWRRQRRGSTLEIDFLEIRCAGFPMTV